MENDNDSYYEERSYAKEVAGPLHIFVNVNVNGSPESPFPVPSSPIAEQELSPCWELPDDGDKFMNLFTRADVVELRNWALKTRNRININEEG